MAFELKTDTLCWQTAENIIVRCFLKAVNIFHGIIIQFKYTNLDVWAHSPTSRWLLLHLVNNLSLFNEAWTDLCFPLFWERWNQRMEEWWMIRSGTRWIWVRAEGILTPLQIAFGARHQRMPPLAREVTSQWCRLNIAACGKSHLGENEFLPKVLLVC